MSEAPVDPIRAARAHMRQAAVKRFYRTVEVREVEGGRHALTLDGRGARTPARNALSATSRALMLKVAAEWERQRETIDPADMPLTRLLNAAIDGVARTMAETRAEILRYAGSDLLCYRAEAPDGAGGASGRSLRSDASLGGRDARRPAQGRRRRRPCSAAASVHRGSSAARWRRSTTRPRSRV